MLIGEVGNNFLSTKKINFLSDRTFIDFDLIIVDYNILLNGFSPSSNYPIETRELFIKRRYDLNEYQTHKKMPIVIFAPTSKTLTFNNTVYTIDFFLPIPSFRVQNEIGEKINIVGNTIFTDFFKKYKEYFNYTSHFTDYEGKIIAKTPHTEKILSYYNLDSIFLPHLKTGFDEDNEKIFLNDLYHCCIEINKEKNEVVLPEWTSAYQLPFEKETNNEISELTIEIENKKKLIESKRLLLKQIVENKVLFCGTGKDLENEVEKIFKELGCEIYPTEEGRDDLIIKYNDKIAVIEIKGVQGTAAEKYAAQLEKWRMNYYTENDVQPKAILLINSFKDQTLDARANETWPHQMLKFAESREHCLITTLQLIGIYFAIQKDPNQKDILMDSLFNTVGIYKGFEDWKHFINKINGNT